MSDHKSDESDESDDEYSGYSRKSLGAEMFL